MCCSKLLICVEPSGPNYEVPMKAQVYRPQQPHTTALLSDRHFVEFGGLPLGQSAYVTVFSVFISCLFFVYFLDTGISELM